MGALSLDTSANGDCPFTDEIGFPRFGPKQAQDRLRLGLSKIPTLYWQWQYLIIGSASGASARTFDSAMGQWNARGQGPDCILEKYQITIADESKATYPFINGRKANGRILFYAKDDQRKWEGYWVEEGGNCADKKDGSNYWGAVTFRFNDTYTRWKGEFDFCGEGKKYPLDGFRQ